jgi:hypothetical protein
VQKVNPFEVNLFMCKGYFYVFLIFKIETWIYLQYLRSEQWRYDWQKRNESSCVGKLNKLI